MADPLLTAQLLSIGTELTAGETRDTNAGELARSLTDRGVRVLRIEALPDQLDVVAAAFEAALARADLVVSTGGLGPTPDDLTREALAEVCAETPAVDRELEAWLRALWARRGMEFPPMNLKQAWLIPSATAIPNANGTAPGWWVARPGGRVAVALPGPPREMRPMWDGWALPRLVERGLGRAAEVRTLRLAGIGESQAAERLGEAVLRRANPEIATYARADAVDVRIAAIPEAARSAADVADEAEALVIDRLGEHVWARGATTWPDAIAAELAARGWTLAMSEAGTGGSLVTLLGGVDGLRRAELRADAKDGSAEDDAQRVREAAASDVGLGLRIADRGDDTAVSVAVAAADGVHRERRLAFLGGGQGRHRAGLAAAHVLLTQLRRRD
jgi:nicotinamide-nucleotide amidase